MTPEEVEAKAGQLAEKLQRKVYPILLNISETDQVVGFVQEPSRQAKIVAIGALMKDQNPVDYGMPILESSLIKEESDPRLYSTNPEHDNIVISAAIICAPIVQLYASEIKKK